VCSVCRRREDPVCEPCQHRIADQLAALPALRERLRVALVPGSGGGERVSTSKGEAPMPVRLAALSLIAGGSDEARCLFVPAVNVWTIVEPDGTKTWHRQLLRDSTGRRVMVLADDQTGVLPVHAWLRSWALEWRRALGHSSATGRPAYAERRTSSCADRRSLAPDWRQQLSATQLGIAPAVPVADRPDDPVADDWDQRWPASGWSAASRAQLAYLRNWLPQACEQLPHFVDFAASLRTLTGAVHAALGDVDDLEYLGRCPEEVTNRATGATSICGALIWHDPYASVITCPRCHTETGQDRRIWLARRILDAWPIDRRRRYPRGLIEILRIPQCVTCSKPIDVEWVNATERADRERFWRPGAVRCPAGCTIVV
jgi:hypothetical protein